MRFETFRIPTTCILDLSPPLAIFGPKEITKNREQPRRHVGARLKRIDICHSAQESFLDKIVRSIDVAAERYGERPQAGNRCEHRVTYGCAHCHYCGALLLGLMPPL